MVVRDVQNVVPKIFPLRARREAIAVDDFKRDATRGEGEVDVRRVRFA